MKRHFGAENGLPRKDHAKHTYFGEEKGGIIKIVIQNSNERDRGRELGSSWGKRDGDCKSYSDSCNYTLIKVMHAERKRDQNIISHTSLYLTSEELE